MVSLIEEEHAKPDEGQFHIKYEFLEKSFTCPLIKTPHRIHSMNEAIVISFRSSLEQLQEYFEKVFVIPIEIFSKDTLIGSVQVRVQDHLKITDLREFLEIYEDKERTAEFDGSLEIQAVTKVQPHLNQPFLKYKYSLQYVTTKHLYKPEAREPQVYLNIIIDLG